MVAVVAVTPEPAFADPGDEVQLSARLLNAVNRDRDLLVSCTVEDFAGTIMFESPPVQTRLTVLSSLDTVDLGNLDTTGYPRGTYEIIVAVTELDGTPIAGGTGTGSLLMGSPVTAAVSVDPALVPPGDSTVEVSLDLASLVTYGTGAIQPIGLVDTRAQAKSLALNGNYAYVGGTEDISVVDISDPANPVITATFGEDVAHDYMACRLVGNHLAVASEWTRLYVYHLDDPALPVRMGEDTTGYNWLHGAFASGDHLFANTDIFGFTSYIHFIRGGHAGL